MRAGLVFTEFTISASDRARFAAWHSNEHARERLDLPGVTEVMRLVDLADPLHFCCLYRATSIGVYATPAYAGLGDRASRLTREILANLKGSRFVGETLGVAGLGHGGLMLRSRRAEWTIAEADATIAAAGDLLDQGLISRIEIAMPGPGGPNISDGAWITLLEGATETGLTEAAASLGTGQERAMFRLEHAIPRG